MGAAKVQSLWISWQQANAEEAAAISKKFVDCCVFSGFERANRRLIATIASKINTEWAEVARAIRVLNSK